MFAGVQESVLESPVLGEVVPAVVFVFPAVVSQTADQRGGKCLGIQGGDSHPLVIGGLGLETALTTMLLGDPFPRVHHARGSGMIVGEWQATRMPKFDFGGGVGLRSQKR
jgi:hypothetical protein